MLDAIVHKAVEHQPTLIKDGVSPPFVDQKGAPHINTFLNVRAVDRRPGRIYTRQFASWDHLFWVGLTPTAA
jgi:hypothetical protein